MGEKWREDWGIFKNGLVQTPGFTTNRWLSA